MNFVHKSTTSMLGTCLFLQMTSLSNHVYDQVRDQQNMDLHSRCNAL